MEEAPPHAIVSADIKTLEELCQKIEEVYPHIQKIQYNVEKDNHVTFWIVSDTQIDQEGFGSIQQSILTELYKKHFHLKCSIHSIRQVNSLDITSQSQEGKQYMREICGRIEAQFSRDQMHIAFENGVFVVYGGAPRDSDLLRTAIIQHIPHILACTVQLKPLVEWEERSAQAVTERTRAAFDVTNIPKPPQALRIGMFALLSGKAQGQGFFFR